MSIAERLNGEFMMHFKSLLAPTKTAPVIRRPGRAGPRPAGPEGGKVRRPSRVSNCEIAITSQNPKYRLRTSHTLRMREPGSDPFARAVD